MTGKTESRSRRASRQVHHQEVTDRIIAALEAGTRPWQRPWRVDRAQGSTMPVNGATGRRYHGINLLLLTMSGFAAASADPRWCTYKQAADRGWQVRRGERGTTVFFYKTLLVDRQEAGSGDEDAGTESIPLLRAFTVFHASQIDGIPPLAPRTAAKTVVERVKDAEIILAASSVPVRIGGDRAFYNPSGDFIQLPPDEAFESPACRASVALHELAHASGHPSRLDRDLTGRFGSSAYSREELRALS